MWRASKRKKVLGNIQRGERWKLMWKFFVILGENLFMIFSFFSLAAFIIVRKELG
jgi:hypothetical protein